MRKDPQMPKGRGHKNLVQTLFCILPPFLFFSHSLSLVKRTRLCHKKIHPHRRANITWYQCTQKRTTTTRAHVFFERRRRRRRRKTSLEVERRRKIRAYWFFPFSLFSSFCCTGDPSVWRPPLIRPTTERRQWQWQQKKTKLCATWGTRDRRRRRRSGRRNVKKNLLLAKWKFSLIRTCKMKKK